MKSANRELVDRLAAEYVLGTLRGRARRRFERWLLSPQVGAIVKGWEDRLSGLEPALRGVTPPSSAWRGIESRLQLKKLERKPAMRWLAIAASAMLVALVGVLATRFGTQPVTQQAFIEADAKTIYWRVELLGDNQEVSIHVHQVHDLPAGKSHELWVIPAGGGAPVSLGLLPHTGDHHRVLTAAQRAALAGAKTIAVSLEPEGGSPNGSPTEVLLTAPLAAV
ncbi:MAG TPA: anti-sigma factor [Burkholderiaceae bacterium]|nr:anti-sigma factor [Burkholderiaceae bacterium]